MFEVVDQAIKTFGSRTSDKVQKKDSRAPIVLELSSWHLENMGEQRLSPHIAVVTNVLPDHLNRYKTIQEYYQAKTNIFKFQHQSDFIILNLDNPDTKKIYNIRTSPQ